MQNYVTTCDLCPPYAPSTPEIHLALHVCVLCRNEVCAQHHRSLSLHLAGVEGSLGLSRHVLSLCSSCTNLIDHDLMRRSNTIVAEVTDMLAISLEALKTEVLLAKAARQSAGDGK